MTTTTAFADGQPPERPRSARATGGLSAQEARSIWDVLVEVCGAYEGPEGDDNGFAYHQTRRFCSEWRFGGSLGGGGKFWRNHGQRPDGTYGQTWYVVCYKEDRTPEREATIEQANQRLWEILQASEQAAAQQDTE